MNPSLTEPLRLRPLYMERVWGGRMLETHFGRTLSDKSTPIGESWEVVDRAEAQSVVEGGPLDGVSLHDLWTTRRQEIFGAHAPDAVRFPLLIKILDARETLSIQVHPPAHLAAQMGGEPKTEMWYIAHAEPDAGLYIGVKPGIDRTAFENALAAGTVADAVHRLEVTAGDFIFIPSGRLHAIGGGLLIFEIQQNSDTTYRVFDWNRTGLDGKPRALHVKESLQCIDFSDTAPAMGQASGDELVRCDFFVVSRKVLTPMDRMPERESAAFSILNVVSGAIEVEERVFVAGDCVLMPACLTGEARSLRAGGAGAVMLETTFT